MLSFKQHNKQLDLHYNISIQESLTELGYAIDDENFIIDLSEAVENKFLDPATLEELTSTKNKQKMNKNGEFLSGYEGKYQIMRSNSSSTQIKFLFPNTTDRNKAALEFAKYAKTLPNVKSVTVGKQIPPEVVLVLDDGYKVSTLFKPDPKNKKSISAQLATVRGEAYAAVCAVAYAMNSSTKFSTSDMKKAYDKCDIQVAFEDMFINNEAWLHSGRISAKPIVDQFKDKSLSASHDNGIMKLISELFKKYKGTFNGDINKWNPSDIWVNVASAENAIRTKLNQASDLLTLNIALEELYNEGVLKGVSLKQSVSAPTMKVYNHTDTRDLVPTIDNVQSVYSKKGFFDAMDVFIFFDLNGTLTTIQFRDFGIWQGEITIPRSKARHGKISGGPLNQILNDRQCVSVPSIPEVVKMINTDQDGFISLFLQYATWAPDISNMNFETFKTTLLNSPLTFKKPGEKYPNYANRWASKYIGCMLLDSYRNQKEGVTKDIFAYASSSLPTSSVFIKTA